MDNLAIESRGVAGRRSRTKLSVDSATVALGLGILAYLVVLLGNLGQIVSQLSWNSDAGGLPMIASSLKTLAHPGFVILSPQPNFLTLFYDYLVAPNRTLWEYAAPALNFFTVGVLVYTTYKLSNSKGIWWTLSLLIALCVSPWLVFTQYTQAYHDNTIFTTVVYAAYLAWVGRSQILGRRHILVGAGMALLVTASVMSDSLLLVTAIGPAILVAGGWWWRMGMSKKRALLLGMPAIIGLFAEGALAALHHYKIIFGNVMFGVPLHPAHLHQIITNLQLLIDGLARMGNGDFYDIAAVPWSIAVAAVGAAFLLGILWLAVVSIKIVLRRWSGEDLTKQVLVFWALSGALLCGGFVGNAAIADRQAFRYLGLAVFVLAATVPLLLQAKFAHALSVKKNLMAGAFAVYALTAAVQLQAAINQQFFRFVQTQSFPQLISALQARGLTHGYAAYWDANSISYQTQNQIQIAPIWQAGNCIPNYCAGANDAVEAWYHSSAGTTFLVVDPSPLMAVYVSQVLPSTGTPTSTFQVDRFTVYVFNHDIGSVVDVPAPQHGHRADGSTY